MSTTGGTSRRAVRGIGKVSEPGAGRAQGFGWGLTEVVQIGRGRCEWCDVFSVSLISYLSRLKQES